MKKNDSSKIYSTEEIATHFNVSKKTVEEILLKLGWIKKDKLPTREGIKIGATLTENNTLLLNEGILSNETFITEINNKINILVYALSQKATKHNNSHKYAYIA